MSNPHAEGKKADPLEQWRELRDTYMDIWAKASGEAVNSDSYAQASGAMLEAFLTTSSPYRDAQKKAMVSALEQCNMPSRDDYVRMADRLGNMELLLDDMDAKLRQVYQLVAKVSAQTAAQLYRVPQAEPSTEVESAPVPEPPAASAFAASEPAEPEHAPKLVPGKPEAVPAPKHAAEPVAAAAPARPPKNGQATKSKPRGTTKSTKKGI